MAIHDEIQPIWVRLPAKNYPIFVGENILTKKALLNRFVCSKQVLIVTNETVMPLYLDALTSNLLAKQCDIVCLKDGEEYKNQASLEAIYRVLIDRHHQRDTTIIALGGGVVGDIAGFAAATYLRGVHFLQIPTTVLSQVDASVGGKTGINDLYGKNMIGSFYHPDAVFIDLSTLLSLPLREYRAGIAEIIKYALLEGGDFLTLVNDALHNGLADKSYSDIAVVVKGCCEIKARYVEMDERESGKRALLNLGHTLGHALEAYSHYTRWLHGEAVAIGLYFSAILSQSFCGLNAATVTLIDTMLALAHLPRRIPRDIPLAALCVLMKNDKKVRNDTVNFILMKEIGQAYREDKVALADLEDTLQRVIEGE